MHVVVCIKHILDPEMPPASFRIAEDGRSPVEAGLPRAIGPFDQNALEVALKLKDARPETTVTVLTAGPAEANEALRKALALNADRAVRVDLERLPGPDSATVAALLAAAIRRLEPAPDLVLVGRQSGDWDQGVVGPVLAEKLGAAIVGLGYAAEPADGGVIITRQVDDGIEKVRPKRAAVVTVTNHESNVLRLPKLKDVVAAHRKPIDVIPAAELGVPLDEPLVEAVSLSIPQREAHCEFLEGEPEEMAAALAERIRRWLSA